MDRSQKGNSHINQIVEDYLTQAKTDYAVLITGGWGIGKTHYVKNILMKKVTPEVNIPKQDEKKYQSILVSLFGLKSREEIFRKILYQLEKESKAPVSSLMTWIPNAVKKLAKDLKLGVGGFQLTLTIPDPAEFLLMNAKKGELCETLLIFDDLERSQLSVVERLGLVDNFLNMGCKVLLIANEEKFTELIEENEEEKEKLRYKQMKEKVIGRTVAFVAEEKEIFESLVDDGITSAQKNDIKECSEKVIQICSEKREILLLNFRILKEAIYIYQKIDNCVSAEKKNVVKRQDLFIRILINSLLTKSAANQGFFQDEKLIERFRQLSDKKKSSSTNGEGNEFSKKDKTELEHLEGVIYLKNCYNLSFCSSIAEYIQDGYLDKEKINIELTKFYSDDLSSIELLRNWAFNAKSELEIKSALEDFWKKVEARDITLYIIKNLVYSLLSLAKQGIAGENLDKMTQKIMDKMNLYEWNNNEYQDFYIFFVEDCKEIKEKIDDIKKAFEKEQLKRNASIANGFIDDYFVQKSIEADASFKNANLEFVQMNDDLIKTIVDSTSTGSSDDYRRIHFFLQSRYNRNERLGKYSTDKDFLEKLRKSLEDKSQSPVKDNLAAYFCQICIKNLAITCELMNSDQN